MTTRDIELNLSSNIRRMWRGCVRGLGVLAIITIYGLGQIGLVTLSGLALSPNAQAQSRSGRWNWGRWGWGRWGRGGRRVQAPPNVVRSPRSILVHPIGPAPNSHRLPR